MFSLMSSRTGVPNKVAGDCEVMREALRSPSDVEMHISEIKQSPSRAETETGACAGR